MPANTMGEMILNPIAQALAAQFSPEYKRELSMTMNDYSWTLPFDTGPLLAGLVLNNRNPDWVWFASGIIGGVAVLGYVPLHGLIGRRLKSLESETAVPFVSSDESGI